MRGQSVKQSHPKLSTEYITIPFQQPVHFPRAFCLVGLDSKGFQRYSNLEAADSFPSVIEMLCSYLWGVLFFLPIPQAQAHGPVPFPSVTLAS